MTLKLYKNCWMAIGFVFLFSCVSQNRMQYISDTKEVDTFSLFTESERLIKPNDEIYIRVSSFDEVAFNFFGNQMENRGMGMSEQAISLISYDVNKDGNIYFPILGEVRLQDLTLLEATDKLKNLLSQYFNQPTILLKFVNKKVSVLGEVNNPGHFSYTENKLSVLQALSLAGDITDIGNRKKVILIREIDGELNTVYLNLTKIEFLSSQYYYINPGDIIYVKPSISAKWLRINSSSYQLALTSITTFLLILNYIN